jgi:RNA polymerase sigma-54 factor
MIKEILSSGQKRLPDQAIVELLSTQGVTLARRTVAKYRKELDIGSSFNR